MTSSDSRAPKAASKKHFDKDGNPSETLIKAKQERLDNWRTLQELAGVI